MTNAPTSTETAAIEHVLEQYIAGGRSGRSEDVQSVFHDDATIFGYLGDELIAGPIAIFYEWHDDNGPAAELEGEVVSIDVADTIATARMKLDNWTGHRFTDMFTLLKTDAGWKITSKVFRLHP